MEALSKFKKGDKTSLKVNRTNNIITKEIIFQ